MPAAVQWLSSGLRHALFLSRPRAVDRPVSCNPRESAGFRIGTPQFFQPGEVAAIGFRWFVVAADPAVVPQEFELFEEIAETDFTGAGLLACRDIGDLYVPHEGKMALDRV